MSPAKHSAICAQIQQLHQAKESKLLARIAELEAQRTWVGLTDKERNNLWQRVQDMDKKMDKMERQLEELVALANKSKGGLWLGMSIASGFSALVGFLASHWKGH